MSFSNNSSPKKGVPLSPGRRSQNSSSYFEKAREVSSKFDELEEKVSILEEECSSFKKAIGDGRKLIQEENKQIEAREKKVRRKMGTPQHPSPRSRAQDLVDYSDENGSRSYIFETPRPDYQLSRSQRLLDSTFSSASGANRNNNSNACISIKNDTYTNKDRNSQSFIPKRDYSSMSINNSYNSVNNDDNSNNSMNYNKNRQNVNDSDGSFEFSQSYEKKHNNSKSLYSQVETSPALSQSMEMYKKDKAIFSLQLKEMQNKITEIDGRVSKAQKILTEPIDGIEMYQNLVEDAERSLIKVQKRLNSFEDNDVDNYHNIIDNIEFLESQNDKRTRELNIKRKRLDEMRSLILRRRNSVNSRTLSRSIINAYSINSKNYSNDSKGRYTSNLSSELALRKIDEAHEKLKQRSLSIQEEEESIDKYENELIQKRKQMEQDWKAKMKRIESLSSEKRNIDRLKLNIHIEETEIEQLQSYLNDLGNEKIEITKRIESSIAESTRNISNSPKNHDDRIAKLNQKRRQLDSIDRKLKEKKRKVNRFEESVRKSIICLKLYNDQVEHLEAQVEEMGQTTQDQLEDLQRETTQLSKSLVTLKLLSNEKNSFKRNRSGENTEEFSDFDNFD